MSVRKYVGLVSAAALGAVTIYGVGCSSSSSSSGTKPPVKDSGTHDNYVPPIPDSSLPDLGVPADSPSGGDAGSCQAPASLTFTATAITPLMGSVCTETIVNNFIEACFGSAATQQGCQAFLMMDAGDTCASCVQSYYAGVSGNMAVPPPAAPVSPWGPLVAIGGLVYTNTGSCVALADPSAAGQACATAYTNLFECEYDACAASCPVTGTTNAEVMAEETALSNCTGAADNGACMTQATALNSACAAYDADGSTAPGAFCFDASFPGNGGTTAQVNNFFQLVLQQCGEPDGG